jgi:hypothetical protein
MEKNSFGFILLVLTAVLAILAALMGAIYAYIYCTKIRPRPRFTGDDRIHYYVRNGQGASLQEEQPSDKPAIQTHPFFIINYMSRLKNSDKQVASSSGASSSYRF